MQATLICRTRRARGRESSTQTAILCQRRLTRRSPDSAGRPRQRAAAEHVHVQVQDALPGTLAVVGDQAVAAVSEAGVSGYLPRGPHHLAEQQRVRVGGAVDRVDVALRDHQRVHRSLRGEIRERQDVVVFEEDPGRDFLVHDPAKQARHALQA